MLGFCAESGFEEEVADVDIATEVVAGIGRQVELPAAEKLPAPHGVHELKSNRAYRENVPAGHT